MKCLNCKYVFTEDLNKCPACGSDKLAETDNDYVSEGKCPNCHADMDNKDICPKCGYSEEKQLEALEKVNKISNSISAAALILMFLPIVGMIILLGLVSGAIALVFKGLVTINELVKIVKIAIIVIPALLILVFAKLKSDDKKPVLRIVALVVALLFVGANVLYYVQPYIRFNDYNGKTETKIAGYTIPLLGKYDKSKVSTSVLVNIPEGTLLTIYGKGILDESVLVKYTALLVDEGYEKIELDSDKEVCYAKYDGENSIVIRIISKEPVNYSSCNDNDCKSKTYYSHMAEYSVAAMDYHSHLDEITKSN